MHGSRIATLDPAPPVPPDGGGGGRWAWLVTASGLVEAELIRGVLEGAAVPVVLDRRDPSPFAWMYLAGNVNAPIQVYVPAALLDSARLQLLESGFGVAEEPEAAPRPAPNAFARATRIAVMLLVLLAALWVILVTYLGSATCGLRVRC